MSWGDRMDAGMRDGFRDVVAISGCENWGVCIENIATSTKAPDMLWLASEAPSQWLGQTYSLIQCFV